MLRQNHQTQISEDLCFGKNHNNQLTLNHWKSVLKQKDWKCFSGLRPRFYMSTENWDNFKTETISKLRQFQNWENILTETISKLRQSQKLSTSPKTEWISKLTQSQRCSNIKTEMPRPFFRNVFPRLVTCRTAIAKLDRGQKNQKNSDDNEHGNDQVRICILAKS